MLCDLVDPNRLRSDFELGAVLEYLLNMRFTAIPLLLLSLANCAFAALGDDDEKIDAMYGYIQKRHLADDGSVSVLYRNEKYFFFVVFQNLRSVSEAYARADGSKLSKKEVTRLLQSNAGTSHWPATVIPPDGKLERNDHKAEAAFIEIDGRAMLQVKRKAK